MKWNIVVFPSLIPVSASLLPIVIEVAHQTAGTEGLIA